MSSFSKSTETDMPQQGEAASIALIRLMSAELRNTNLDDRRAAELAADFREIVAAARTAARNNDFTDEPSRYLAVLSQLSAGGIAPP